MKREDAEALAIEALAFIAGDSELLPRFLSLTGIKAGQIREAAREPGFLAGVLQFVAAHEPTLLSFAESAQIAPTSVGAALRALPFGSDHYDRSTRDAMSDDPETLRQIEELSHDERPLLVVDVDEVVLEFATPFTGFLAASGLELGQEAFRLHGNITSRDTGGLVPDEAVSALIEEFWGVQADWQQLAAGAPDVLERLSAEVSVILLTAMPHRFREHRRKHLAALGLPYPLLTTETPKGPAVARLRGPSKRPVAFVDDIPRNHLSVREAVPDAALFHLMAHAGFRALLPPLPDGVTAVEDWPSAEPVIRQALALEP